MKTFKRKYYLEKIIKLILIYIAIALVLIFFKITSSNEIVEVNFYCFTGTWVITFSFAGWERQYLENSEFTKKDFKTLFLIGTIINVILLTILLKIMLELSLLIILPIVGLALLTFVHVIRFKRQKKSYTKNSKINDSKNYKIDNKIESFIHYPTIITALVLIVTNNNLTFIPIIIILASSYVLSIVLIGLISYILKRCSND